MKGNLAYQGSSGTYKSKRRRIQSTNFDSHYWPFCKQQGIEHTAEKLILTQIICGDTLNDMYNQVQEMTKKCKINLDCNSHSPIKKENTTAIKTNVECAQKIENIDMFMDLFPG